MSDSGSLVERIKKDIIQIRSKGDRTGSLEHKAFRWVGEPNGYRLYGDLANDLEEILGILGENPCTQE